MFQFFAEDDKISVTELLRILHATGETIEEAQLLESLGEIDPHHQVCGFCFRF